MTFYYFQAW